MRMRVLSEHSEAKDLSAFPQPRGILPPCFRLSAVGCRLLTRLSSLECALTQSASLTPLECAVTKRGACNSFRMRSYKKSGGVPTQENSVATSRNLSPPEPQPEHDQCGERTHRIEQRIVNGGASARHKHLVEFIQ